MQIANACGCARQHTAGAVRLVTGQRAAVESYTVDSAHANLNTSGQMQVERVLDTALATPLEVRLGTGKVLVIP